MHTYSIVQVEVKFTVNPEKHNTTSYYDRVKKKIENSFRLVRNALKKHIERRPEESSHSNNHNKFVSPANSHPPN